MTSPLTRRSFLRTASAAGLATAVTLFTRAQPPPAPPITTRQVNQGFTMLSPTQTAGLSIPIPWPPGRTR